MAKQMITLLTDDLDGSEANQTITFAFDGSNYTIDLNDKHAQEFRELMERFTAAGSRTGRHSTDGNYRPGATLRRTEVRNLRATRDDNAKIRAWAVANGYELAERGRIPVYITEAYEQGTPNPVPIVAAPAEPAPEPEPAATKPAPRKRTATKAAAS